VHEHTEGKPPKEVVFEDEKTQLLKVVFEPPPLRKLPSGPALCRDLDALAAKQKIQKSRRRQKSSQSS